MDRHVEIVGILIARRVVADFLSFGVLALELMLALVDIERAARHLGKVHDIRVDAAPVACARSQPLPLVLIEVDLHVAADGLGRVKRSDLLFVGFTVCKLLFDLLDRTSTAIAKERGELVCAILAQIAILQLAVAQKPDLVTAYVTVFLVKQSHKYASF